MKHGDISNIPSLSIGFNIECFFSTPLVENEEQRNLFSKLFTLLAESPWKHRPPNRENVMRVNKVLRKYGFTVHIYSMHDTKDEKVIIEALNRGNIYYNRLHFVKNAVDLREAIAYDGLLYYFDDNSDILSVVTSQRVKALPMYSMSSVM